MKTESKWQLWLSCFGEKTATEYDGNIKEWDMSL